mmetsp:Transcript_10806/g.24553  ORF Transcript_10806/g.24553 Transcript_10806/m.24553 type:complete len:95 (-) Transcript_10806:55-339(-)
MCIAVDVFEHDMHFHIQETASRKPETCEKLSPVAKTLFDDFYGCSRGNNSCSEQDNCADLIVNGSFSFLSRDAITALAQQDPRLSSVLLQLSSF